jgi:SpoIID/LytB domain protein
VWLANYGAVVGGTDRYNEGMKRGLILLLGLVMSVGLIFIKPSTLFAATIEELGIEIQKLTNDLAASREATKPLESELASLRQRINSARVGIAEAKAQIQEREEDVAVQYTLLSGRVAQQYKRSRTFSLLLLLFQSTSASELTKNLAYGSSVQAQDNRMIREFTEEIVQLEKDQATLAALEKKLAVEADFFAGEIAEAEEYQQTLSSKIASLTAQQQQLIAQKLGSLNLPSSLGAGPLYCTDDRNLNPGFGNAYAFYTFGIPHRVGMSQYGAYGRANAGQSYDQILRAYYNFDGYEDRGSVTVKVNNGNGVNQGSVIWTGSLEDYVKRIYEIPASWPKASLEAQAIAARSYVLSVTNNGNDSICANQYCQVFKTDPKGGDWDGAVSSTTGKVMVVGGQPITAWYASTAGGYTFTNSDVWGGSLRSWTKRLKDTSGDVGSFADLQSKAYDKDSPCMYSAQGYRNQYGKSAWLKGEEVADIVNVILLARADGSTKDHLYQTDKPHPYGGEVWDEARVRQELSNRGGSPLSNVSNISISGVDWGTGITTNITIEGRSFSGDEFKDWFNLRAPANIQIVGPLFNVEKK